MKYTLKPVADRLSELLEKCSIHQRSRSGKEEVSKAAAVG